MCSRACRGVKKGDTVAIYMPTCPLAVASMLACARIGAVHRYIMMLGQSFDDETNNYSTIVCI
jgi:acyl-coenzyme A synthetase/AMP-(fatty) acid ligase